MIAIVLRGTRPNRAGGFETLEVGSTPTRASNLNWTNGLSHQDRFQVFFDFAVWNAPRRRGTRRLSYAATSSATFGRHNDHLFCNRSDVRDQPCGRLMPQ